MSGNRTYTNFTNTASLEKEPLFCKKKPFSCRFCHKNFQTESILAVHAEKAHQNIMMKERKDKERLAAAAAFGFPCKVCHRIFASAADRGAHERTAHPVRSPHELGNTFATSSKPPRPSNNRTSNRPFSCDVCARSFTRLAHLTAHSKIHSEEKKFKCTDCGKSFLRSASLTEHQQTHTNLTEITESKAYTCDVCHKSFPNLSAVIIHKRVHMSPSSFVEKPRPYECEVCHRTFSYLYSLTAHQVINNPLKKAYTCTTCKKSFQNMAALSSHVKSQHMNIGKRN